jgi:hypothetical protein
MRHKSLIPFLVACAVLVAAPVALSASGQPSALRGKKLASVKLKTCARSPDDRHAVFRARMRRVRHTTTMSLRFTLQERVGDARYKSVDAPGLGEWHTSKPGVRRFAFRQRVDALAAGASYRVKVGYRWYDADGNVIKRARRRSRGCKQPGRLPNLRIARVRAHRLTSGWQYLVQVVNRGKGPAGPSAVGLTVDGTPFASKTTGGLAAGLTRTLRFNGPACTAGLEAQADVTDSVRETSEHDNALISGCPTPK